MAGCEVHHLLEGDPDAPPLVLVNSLGSDLRMWEAQAAVLRERFRVVRFDMRGHGASPLPPGRYSLADLGDDLVALLNRLEIPTASICGVSIGGATAMWMAARLPERVERLAVCFSSAMFGSPEDWRARARLVREQGTGAVADAVVARWFTASGARERPELVRRMRDMIAATPAEGYAQGCEAVAEIDLRDQLGAITAPTLVISGAEDPATPPAHGRAIAASIPESRFVEMEQAAHLGNLERPGLFNELIEEHLGQVPFPTAAEEAGS